MNRKKTNKTLKIHIPFSFCKSIHFTLKECTVTELSKVFWEINNKFPQVDADEWDSKWGNINEGWINMFFKEAISRKDMKKILTSVQLSNLFEFKKIGYDRKKRSVSIIMRMRKWSGVS